MPLAVPGRWRATTSPPIAHARPWRRRSRSALVTAPRGLQAGAQQAQRVRWTVRPTVA